MKKNINRREFLGLLGSGAAFAILPPGCTNENNNETDAFHTRATIENNAELAPWDIKYSGPAKHVIFISLDTTRADHLGCYGNTWMHTPRFDAFAAESILFNDYMTVVPTTLASHTALFTGKYPHTHGTPRNGFMVNKRNIMLPEILKTAGFHTAGFLGSFALHSRFNFAQGFDYFNEDFDQFRGENGIDQNQRTAKSVNNAVMNYFEKQGVPSNLFLFIHYFDAHAPYAPPDSFKSMYHGNDEIKTWLSSCRLRDNHVLSRFPGRKNKDNKINDKTLDLSFNYAGEISYMDEQFGYLIDYLKKKGILDESIVIITSDHGENSVDHPVFYDHGWTLYQSTMQAVFMVRLPHADKAGTRVNQLCASIDCLPTLLKYIGLSIPKEINGEAIDLFLKKIVFPPRVRFGEATKPGAKLETNTSWYNFMKQRCVRDRNFKFIRSPYQNTEELYNLSSDPHEQNNLLKNITPEISGTAEALRKKLKDWSESATPLPSHFNKREVSDTIRRLRSLGYMK